jgi:hypothetical protein
VASTLGGSGPHYLNKLGLNLKLARWVARWLDGLDGHFDSLDRIETKRSKCCDGRVLSTHTLPISVDPVLHFQMTQAAGGIVSLLTS